MMRVIFREPTASDLDVLAAHMRPMDALECRLAGRREPREALEEGVSSASWVRVAEIDGEVICCFGLTEVSFLGEEAHPWMLCASGIEKHARVVLTCAKRFLAQMQEESERLSNVVHAHNRSAIRFLKWCGFAFGEKMTIKGEPFLEFSWSREAKAPAYV